MPASAGTARLVPWWLALVLVVVAALGALWFLQTAALVWLVAGLALPVFVVKARWVFLDARTGGLPAGPWALVAFLLPVVGLMVYLVVRGTGARS